MADRTQIEWTDATANVVNGCSVVSPGCTNCYAMRLAGTRMRSHPTREGLTIDTKAGPVWTGEVRFNEKALQQVLNWTKERMIFWNAHGDLFHDSVPDDWIDRCFAVMALTPQHKHQCLTKRSARMRAYMTGAGVTQRVAKAMDAVRVDMRHVPVEKWAAVPDFPAYEASSHGSVRRDGAILQVVVREADDRPTLTLWRENKPFTRYVHHLVLLAFVGRSPEGFEARHLNGSSLDNRLANLEWSDRSTNQADKVRHGSNGGPAKITREQAAEIRAARAGGRKQQVIADEYGISRSLVSMIESRTVWPDAMPWPLPNVWLGVSVEDQKRADERIPDLLATPAAVRWISAEPLLGPVDLTNIAEPSGSKSTTINALRDRLGSTFCGSRLDWVVAGGESGPGARPLHPDWTRSLRDQCAAAAVAFLHKQNGEFAPGEIAGEYLNPEKAAKGMSYFNDRWDECWSEPEGHCDDEPDVYRVGKKRAGRLLDGVQHDGYPG